MSKQDRQGVRKASDIEQKYDLAALSKLNGMNQHQSEQLSKISQTLSQFIVNTNAKFESMHPVGSVYVSLDNTNPASLFGGTWELIMEGYLVVGLEQESEESLPELLQTLDPCYLWKRTA